MITYQEEQYENILEEIKPLHVKQWNELANHKDTRPLNPNYDLYISMNRESTFRTLTVRDEGILIGYASFFISFNPHYMDWKYAVCDVYYIEPIYRSNGIGAKMVEEVEIWLKNLGINSITIQDKVNHSHESFFVKLGYKPVEQLYEKVI